MQSPSLPIACTSYDDDWIDDRMRKMDERRREVKVVLKMLYKQTGLDPRRTGSIQSRVIKLLPSFPTLSFCPTSNTLERSKDSHIVGLLKTFRVKVRLSLEVQPTVMVLNMVQE